MVVAGRPVVSTSRNASKARPLFGGPVLMHPIIPEPPGQRGAPPKPPGVGNAAAKNGTVVAAKGVEADRKINGGEAVRSS